MPADGADRVAIPVAELPAGAALPLEAFGTTLALFNVAGRLFALENRCLHHGGPLCLGRVGGAQLPSTPGRYRYDAERPVVTCPWHGWEYELESGRALFKRGVRVRTFAVELECDEIAVYNRRLSPDRAISAPPAIE
jgi:3-phenylpropionate/trans-cinnamate dioxygenase ferredoxin subunit